VAAPILPSVSGGGFVVFGGLLGTIVLLLLAHYSEVLLGAAIEFSVVGIMTYLKSILTVLLVFGASALAAREIFVDFNVGKSTDLRAIGEPLPMRWRKRILTAGFIVCAFCLWQYSQIRNFEKVRLLLIFFVGLFVVVRYGIAEYLIRSRRKKKYLRRAVTESQLFHKSKTSSGYILALAIMQICVLFYFSFQVISPMVVQDEDVLHAIRSHTIGRPGMTMLKSSGSTVAAYDPEQQQLVIVAYNTAGSTKDMSFDLSGFGSVGASAQIIRTSNTESWANAGTASTSGTALNVSLPANSISTFIVDGVTGGKALENQIDITSDMISGSNAWNNSSNDCYKVFDGSASTYFDGVGNGWVQVDLGNIYDISAIGYAPRSGYEYRCPDGMFMVSNDGQNWETIYTIPAKPSGGMNYITRFTGGTAARYVRYQVPEGTPTNQWNKDNTYCCNIAEIELYGTLNVAATQTKLTPAAISGSNAWNNSANDYTKVFDGDTATYFDGVGNGWVQADLGALYEITALGYAPRKGYEYRCPDSMFQISQDGKTWTTIYTVPNQPAFAMQYIKSFDGDMTARYVRYTVPEGAPQNFWNADDVYCCNISELEIYGNFISEIAVEGDVNADGSCSVADMIALQKWLIQTTDAKLADWQAADLYKDGVLNGFDLVLMKRLLM